MNSLIIHLKYFSPHLVSLVILHRNHITHPEDILILLSFFFKGRFRDNHLSAFIIIPISIFIINKHLESISGLLSQHCLLQGRERISCTEKKKERLVFWNSFHPFFSILAVIYMQLVSYRYYFIFFCFHLVQIKIRIYFSRVSLVFKPQS